ncbi:trna (guanine-n-)-methyltransferase [Phaffia rhodozyma]|uniref:tRNA (guanine(37)-N1)-methyltransferase n=1 Tax=Phaffia rhodozyma TaxID=264483 RepID=A0A0F7SGL9_PHARH|nr:trna (guanine-n-)-methyltransferase [Phaffia rhodozyma]
MFNTSIRPAIPKFPGMTTLDKEAFNIQIPVVRAKVPTSAMRQINRNPLFKMTKQSGVTGKGLAVVTDEKDSDMRWIPLPAHTKADLPQETLDALLELAGFVEVEDSSVTLGWNYWTVQEIISAILPEDADMQDGIPSSFTMTGHVAHLNLKKSMLPYRFLIGQILLDKAQTIETVVNKLDTIEDQFRVFKMELLAGKDDYLVSQIEQECKFTFDFSQVYWNSRLTNEHRRLVNLFNPGDLVVDVMAGVGPFVVPAAKKGCYVLGNDLNPHSYKYMRLNTEQNKVVDNVRLFNDDGRNFIQTIAFEAYMFPFLEPSLERQLLCRPDIPNIGKIPGSMGFQSSNETHPPVDSASRQTEHHSSHTFPDLAILHSDSRSAVSPSDPTSTTTTTTTTTTPNTTVQHPNPDVAGRSRRRVKAPKPIYEPTLFIKHFVMNLPDSALEFLDAYRGCYRPLVDDAGLSEHKIEMPMIHVHCFAPSIAEGAHKEIFQRASERLGYTIDPANDPTVYIEQVRLVAPKKWMYCLGFTLPREVAFACKGSVGTQKEEEKKEAVEKGENDSTQDL